MHTLAAAFQGLKDHSARNLKEVGRRETYRIVGEDEAEPSRGTLSYVSPVARGLMGKQVGDLVRVGSFEAEILEIRPSW
jgi:transcription elongation GreA/GreB family factor